MHTLQLLQIAAGAAGLPDLGFASELIKQGPLIIALIAAIKYFYARQIALEARIQGANDKLESYMAADRDILIKIVQGNTDVLSRNTAVMSEMEQYLKDNKKP